MKIIHSILFCLFFTLTGFNSLAQESKFPDVLTPQEHIPNRKPVGYSALREADMMWSKRVWRVIDLREKMNHPLYYPDQPLNDRKSMFDVIKDAAKKGKITGFSNPLIDDEFRYEMTITEFNEMLTSWDTLQIQDPQTLEYVPTAVPDNITTDKIWKYWVKEDWYFDKQRSVLEVRILGICPVIEKVSESGERLGADKPLFWIYFPEARPLFATSEVFMRKNDAERRTLDDIFWKRMFSSYIRKESNVYNRGIYDYKTGMDQLIEAERVKEDIFKFEHDLFHF
ncbi:MAG: gliding motility protein GldN [Bacteroidota bacterium]|nr:gliding motility protein GldN [Bacteroidota bacterium]